jgi:hypothetical protein
MTKLAPLSFEKALSRLLGLMGESVDVTIYSEEPFGPLARFRGELTRGGRLRRPVYMDSDEAFLFSIEGEADASFVLERRMLRRACTVERSDGAPSSLRFFLGASTLLQIDPQDAPDP